MSRRRVSKRRKNVSEISGVLDDKSDASINENNSWWQRVRNSDVYRRSSIYPNKDSTKQLESNSELYSTLNSENWHERLNESHVTHKSRTSTVPQVIDSDISNENQSPIVSQRKRKTWMERIRQRGSMNPFADVFQSDSSASEIIASGKSPKITQKSAAAESESSSDTEPGLKRRKTRPAFLQNKVRNSQKISNQNDNNNSSFLTTSSTKRNSKSHSRKTETNTSTNINDKSKKSSASEINISLKSTHSQLDKIHSSSHDTSDVDTVIISPKVRKRKKGFDLRKQKTRESINEFNNIFVDSSDETALNESVNQSDEQQNEKRQRSLTEVVSERSSKRDTANFRKKSGIITNVGDTEVTDERTVTKNKLINSNRKSATEHILLSTSGVDDTAGKSDRRKTRSQSKSKNLQLLSTTNDNTKEEDDDNEKDKNNESRMVHVTTKRINNKKSITSTNKSKQLLSPKSFRKRKEIDISQRIDAEEEEEEKNEQEEIEKEERTRDTESEKVDEEEGDEEKDREQEIVDEEEDNDGQTYLKERESKSISSKKPSKPSLSVPKRKSRTSYNLRSESSTVINNVMENENIEDNDESVIPPTQDPPNKRRSKKSLQTQSKPNNKKEANLCSPLSSKEKSLRETESPLSDSNSEFEKVLPDRSKVVLYTSNATMDESLEQIMNTLINGEEFNAKGVKEMYKETLSSTKTKFINASVRISVEKELESFSKSTNSNDEEKILRNTRDYSKSLKQHKDLSVLEKFVTSSPNNNKEFLTTDDSKTYEMSRISKKRELSTTKETELIHPKRSVHNVSVPNDTKDTSRFSDKANESKAGNSKSISNNVQVTPTPETEEDKNIEKESENANYKTLKERESSRKSHRRRMTVPPSTSSSEEEDRRAIQNRRKTSTSKLSREKNVLNESTKSTTERAKRSVSQGKNRNQLSSARPTELRSISRASSITEESRESEHNDNEEICNTRLSTSVSKLSEKHETSQIVDRHKTPSSLSEEEDRPVTQNRRKTTTSKLSREKNVLNESTKSITERAKRSVSQGKNRNQLSSARPTELRSISRASSITEESRESEHNDNEEICNTQLSTSVSKLSEKHETSQIVDRHKTPTKSVTECLNVSATQGKGYNNIIAVETIGLNSQANDSHITEENRGKETPNKSSPRSQVNRPPLTRQSSIDESDSNDNATNNGNDVQTQSITEASNNTGTLTEGNNDKSRTECDTDVSFTPLIIGCDENNPNGQISVYEPRKEKKTDSPKQVTPKPVTRKPSTAQKKVGSSQRTLTDYFKLIEEKQGKISVDEKEEFGQLLQDKRVELREKFNKQEEKQDEETKKKEVEVQKRKALLEKKRFQEQMKKRRLENEAKQPNNLKINGQVYRQPKLPRPATWVTNRLYRYLWKKMEPQYKIHTRVKSEKLVKQLVEVVKFVEKTKNYENYEDLLEGLKRSMARKGIVTTHDDFFHFCYDYLPWSFRRKAVPIAVPGNHITITFPISKISSPILESEE